MRTRILLSAAIMAIFSSMAFGQVIDLPQPALSETATLKEALEKRCSHREFDPERVIHHQELSNLLWAGWGFNRDEKRTAPSALNRQEVTLYVCTPKGIFKYDAFNNQLELISKDNIMSSTGKQPFVKDAAINIIYVCDKNKSSSAEGTAVCCGAISQNIALYGTTIGLGNVVRGMFDAKELHKLLKLKTHEVIMLTQSVGYPKQ